MNYENYVNIPMYVDPMIFGEIIIPLTVLDIDPDKYLVSNFGYVISKLKNSPIVPAMSNNTNPTISISTKYGTRKTYRLDSIIANAFIPNPSCMGSIYHKNGDQNDCSAHNLAWMDRETLTVYNRFTDPCYTVTREVIGWYTTTIPDDVVRAYRRAKEYGLSMYQARSLINYEISDTSLRNIWNNKVRPEIKP